MLKGSLHVMLMLAGGKMQDQSGLQNLAKIHDRDHRNIPPPYYDLWLESIIWAVERSDPEFDDNLDQAWRAAMQPGIEFMRSKY